MKQRLLFILLALAMSPVFAQNLEYSGVTRFTGRGVGTILKGEEITGYYTYFMVDKKDKKNNVYQVEIANTNLEKVGSFDFACPKSSYILEVAFNGKFFMFVSYVPEKKGRIEYSIYDIAGKLQGKYKFEELNTYSKALINQKIQAPDVENITTFALGETGFLVQNMVDVGKNGYVLDCIDNTGKKVWSYGSKQKAPTHEGADVLSADENNIAVYVGKKKNAIGGGPAQFSMVVLDSKTGDELFSDELEENGNQVSILNCFFEKDRKSMTLIGELYKPDEEPLKDQSVGLFIKEMGMDGTIKSMTKYLWAKEINKVKQAKMTDEQKESEKNSALYIHKVLRAKDGTLTLIAEQYKKAVSALGTASAVLSGGRGGASTMKMVVMNMVVMQFASDMSIKDYRIISKGRRDVMLPSGAGLLPPATLAAYIKTTGGFDYIYTSADKASDKYTVIYTDANRKEEGSKGKNDVMVGAIHIKGSEYTTNRNPVNTDAYDFYLKPAKTGYVMITEYFKKEKKVKTRLENMKD